MMSDMVSGKWLVLAGGIVGLGLVLVGMWWLGDSLSRRPAAGQEGAVSRMGPGEVDEEAKLDAVRKRSGRASGAREGKRELGEAVDFLAQLSEDELASEVSRMAAGWEREQLADAVERLTAQAAGGGPAAHLRDALLQRWVQTSRDEASAWVAGLVAGGGGAAEATVVALGWRDADADGAWAWVESLPAGEAREEALRSLLYEQVRDDAAHALERLPAGAVGREWDLLVDHAVANWAAEDPQAALAWVKQVSDPSRRDRAFGSLATAWAESDPAAAATLAAAAMVEGPTQERAVAAVVQRWAQQDPAAVRAWVEAFPEGPLKQDALRLIAEQASAPKADGGEGTPPPQK